MLCPNNKIKNSKNTTKLSEFSLSHFFMLSSFNSRSVPHNGFPIVLDFYQWLLVAQYPGFTETQFAADNVAERAVYQPHPLAGRVNTEV